MWRVCVAGTLAAVLSGPGGESLPRQGCRGLPGVSGPTEIRRDHYTMRRGPCRRAGRPPGVRPAVTGRGV